MHGISIGCYLVVFWIIEIGSSTSTHAGPDIRIIAIAARPGAEESAKIVSSDGERASCCCRECGV